MTFEAEMYWSGAGLIALWLALFGLALAATRNGAVVAGPATQEFGEDPESPAVVALLANRWRSVDRAAAATLLDLAARGVIEVRQPDDDPARSTVHLTGKDAGDLTPYERRVLHRVAERAGATGAPIGAIAFRAEERATSWNSELRQEIIAEARLRGLSRPRFGRILAGALLVTLFVPGAPFTVAAVSGGHGIRAAVFVGVLPAVVLMWLLKRALGERATRRGLDRAGHWAGVASWLHAHEEFAQLPPAAVTVWDRYLGYGAALGVTSRAGRLLGFDAGDKRRVWSSYGGTWRPVRIRYPRVRPGFGAKTADLVQLACAAAVVAVGLYLFATLRQPDWAVPHTPATEHSVRRPGLILSAGWVGVALLGVLVAGRFNRWMFLVGFLAMMPGNFVGWSAVPPFDTMDGPLPIEMLFVAGFAALTVYYVVLAVLERRAAHTVTGEVLRMEPRRRKSAPRFLALDTGQGDRTIAWALPRGAPAVAPGSIVRLSVSPATRVVRSAVPVVN
ncbi:DUF2207 domain-containing protein [Streptomyces sp. NBC_00083]|uniref:DUF2207 family protein n=1 Tax=Streptomyces sp. NBC_00083 TaxID=2975647 RepID=UPI00224E5F2D|nr:DUF2207 domain-containing protein [Streptomyces sp. NBC_00083]MCX5384438.1 DUF2207 domain-containing protein [Streptomyces sp. NBC_00083]